MRQRDMRLEDVGSMLKKRCDKVGGQMAFARAHGLHQQHISQVVNGQRPPSPRLCKALGIEPAGMRWTKVKD